MRALVLASLFSWAQADTAGARAPADSAVADRRALQALAASKAGAGPGLAQTAYLKAFNTDGGDAFGVSVAIDGDTAVVGASFEDGEARTIDGADGDAASRAGAAYVFRRTSAGWAFEAYLKPANGATGDEFGEAVAVDGDTVVVGAPREDGSGTGVDPADDDAANRAGAAYVFVRDGGAWSQQAYLKASNTGSMDAFGQAVAIDGDTVVVGAWLEDGGSPGVDGPDNDDVLDAGAAYVYTRSGTNWSQQAYLKAADTAPGPGFGDGFGWSVAISGDRIVVGAPGEDGSATVVDGAPDEARTDAGAAYVFDRSGGAWSQVAYLKAFNGDADDIFGWSVGVDGERAVVGALREDGNARTVDGPDDDGAPDAGAAYLFAATPGGWVHEAYLKPANTGAGDGFGHSVGISGEAALVGAWQEDGEATGIDGPDSDGATSAGAAHLFRQEPGGWSQAAYLKASNTDAGDQFGTAVDLDGHTAIVGAGGEASIATGVNGDGTDDTAAGAGAAYVFAVPPARVLTPAPTPPAPGAQLGAAAAADGNLVAFGRPNAAGGGEVVVYRVEGQGLVEDAVVPVPPGFVADDFGAALALEGNRLLVGAPGSTPPQPKGGGATALRAALFERLQSAWSFKEPFAPSAGAGDQAFGTSVGLDGELVVVGAPDGADGGAVYAYQYDGSTVLAQAVLRAATPAPGDKFGQAVAANGGRLAVGAPGSLVGGALRGSVSIYDQVLANLGGLAATATVTGSASTDGSAFGGALALAGDTLAVGAAGEDGGAAGAGAAYLFEFSGATLVERARLLSPQPEADSGFGSSVALGGAGALVGAPAAAGGVGRVFRFPDASPGGVETLVPPGQETSAFGAAVAAAGNVTAVGAPLASDEAGSAFAEIELELVFATGFE